MSGIEKLQFDHAQIVYILDLGVKKCFFMKILLILPKFHEKTLSHPGDIKFFRPGRTSREDVHVQSSPIYGRSVKWRNTINEIGGNIPRGNFLGGNFPGGGGVPGRNFPRTDFFKAKISNDDAKFFSWSVNTSANNCSWCLDL